ncbi:MAG TPA: hypothetical protein PKM21_05035 [Anaerolineales bacterium]|nr:hypothetical protein [Anaerolineales bacterium]
MVKRILQVIIGCLVCVLVLGASTLPPGDKVEQARRFTRAIEFDYVAWTLEALGVKLGQGALGTVRYLPSAEYKEQVIDYLYLVWHIWDTERKIDEVYADPGVADAEGATRKLRMQLEFMKTRRNLVQPVVEAIVQSQISAVLADMDLTLGGQPVPPLLYHTTPPPDALIISPRDAIRQDHNISLSPDMPTDQVVALEEQVDEALNVSSLVVGIGGIGLYPTMVMQTTDINWLMEVVAHEWVHNYLTVHPLGMMYLANPEMRIINETTAEIAGKEIGQAVMARFYPEYAPAPAEPASETTQETTPEPAKPVFSFRAAMYETRLNVETMLAEGKIEEAEAYMEERRLYMWENGYQIRKLNQAYFAFHGAYADQPGGAAGEDPVSAAVRALRAQSPTLASFINRLAWMWSYDQLKDVVTGGR